MEQANQQFPNLLMSNEEIKSIYNQLKAIVDELKDLGVLVNENLANFQQELESIRHFCQGDYKFSFLIQGEMNAGKSTCLNALLGERVLAVSSVPETNFLTCVIPDRGVQIPMLYKAPLSKIYNSYTSSFHVNETDLEFTGVSGAENIFKHLNGSNQASRDKIKQMMKEAQENQENNQDMEEKAQELYKDAELHDTVYVIKCRIPWIEEKIKDEFILKRIQFIDFPGMFEYGHNKISEIYKVFEDNSQGVIHILDHLGYQSKATTKLQNYKKYPGRMVIIVNKMDQIPLNEEDQGSSLNTQEKAKRLADKVEDFLRQNSEIVSEDAQKTKYLEMSKEVKMIINFVTAKEEAMKQYALRYRESKTQQEKDLWDRVLKECVEDDQTYRSELRRAKKQNKPFAEMNLFDYFIQSENNLFVKLQENLKEKFMNRFGELVTQDIPKKANSIRKQLIDMIEKVINQKDVNEAENVHSLFICDGCKADPIVGVRYHCKACDDFDFCEPCKQTKHHPEHEFQVIPKEDLKSYMHEFCTKNIEDICKGIDDFREKFNEKLMELFFSLGEIFKEGGNDGAVETFLKNHCINYTKLKDETMTKFEQIREKVARFVPIITLKWIEKNGIIGLISGMETEKIMKALFDRYEFSLVLLITGCAHLFQAIATTTMKKPSAPLIQPLYEGVEILSVLLKNPYEMEVKITKFSELEMGISKWQNHFWLFSAQIAQDIKESTQNLIELMPLIDAIIELEFQDEEKNKERNEKLEVVLQKLKSIKEL